MSRAFLLSYNAVKCGRDVSSVSTTEKPDCTIQVKHEKMASENVLVTAVVFFCT